uniref:CUB_2 domain-containing protein n=1 Tax=Caenorhabditis tropicalis TaxID=1561998 RepID=A0A1I7TPY8_9PELO
MYICLVILVGSVLADPQIVWLNRYSSDSTNNIVTVETGGRLYLASNDSSETLKRIRILSGTSGVTLDQLPVGGIDLLSDQLVIQSALDLTTSATITGFLYATMSIQARDNTFEVIVVNGPREYHWSQANKTLVILNVQFTTSHIRPADAPDKTTLVTNVTQHQNTDLNFHYGYPDVNYTIFTENQFFENPQYVEYLQKDGNVTRERIIFESVEPIQVNLPYWYITANGPFSLQLDSFYMNFHTHNTTNVNTTGAYVLTDVWQDHFVNFVTDPTRKGWTGTLVTLDLQQPINITFANDMTVFYQAYSGSQGLKHAQVMSDMVSKTLSITAAGTRPGTLYCQYFVYTGELLPPTPSPTTNTVVQTTPTIATTTKSSESFNVLITIILFLCILMV